MPKKHIPTGNLGHLTCTPDRVFQHPPVVDWMARVKASPHAGEVHGDALAIMKRVASRTAPFTRKPTAQEIGFDLGISEERAKAALAIVVRLGVLRKAPEGRYRACRAAGGSRVHAEERRFLAARIQLSDDAVLRALRDRTRDVLTQNLQPIGGEEYREALDIADRIARQVRLPWKRRDA